MEARKLIDQDSGIVHTARLQIEQYTQPLIQARQQYDEPVPGITVTQSDSLKTLSVESLNRKRQIHASAFSRGGVMLSVSTICPTDRSAELELQLWANTVPRDEHIEEHFSSKDRYGSRIGHLAEEAFVAKHEEFAHMLEARMHYDRQTKFQQFFTRILS